VSWSPGSPRRWYVLLRQLSAEGGNAFGLKADADGNIYAADFNSHKLFHGLNDLCFDKDGNLYFTDPRGSGVKSPFGAVYRLSKSGAPDQTKLYVSDTGTNSILVWNLGRDGTIANRRTLHQFPDMSVDGLSFDEAGRLWVARLDHASLDVLSKDGKLLKSYAVTSSGKVTNTAWWEHSLYVTTSVENVIRKFDLLFGGAPAIPARP
jgi:sugar lactone lactonase YvrE